MNPPSKPPRPRQVEIAKALGISPRRVRELQRSGMPVDSIAAAQAWRESQGQTTCASSAETLRRRRIELVGAQAERQKIANKAALGELVDLEQVISDVHHITAMATAAFIKLSNDLPPRLAGLGEAQMQAVMRTAIHTILTELNRDLRALHVDEP